MHGFEIADRTEAFGPRDPISEIRHLISTRFDLDTNPPPIRAVHLYYVRQATIPGTTPRVVPYFAPDFCYALDFGWPRVAVIAVPYLLPGEKTDGLRRSIGWGDPAFPTFDSASILSAENMDDILYPAAAGELLLAPKAGVSDDRFVDAVRQHCFTLSKHHTYWKATVRPFHESDVAAQLQSLTDIVRYAELNVGMRSSVLPWFVDRVL